MVARQIGEVRRLIAVSPTLLSKYGSTHTPEELSRLPWVALSTSIAPRLIFKTTLAKS